MSLLGVTCTVTSLAISGIFITRGRRVSGRMFVFYGALFLVNALVLVSDVVRAGAQP